MGYDGGTMGELVKQRSKTNGKRAKVKRTSAAKPKRQMPTKGKADVAQLTRERDEALEQQGSHLRCSPGYQWLGVRFANRSRYAR